MYKAYLKCGDLKLGPLLKYIHFGVVIGNLAYC